ncbi:MAG: hypothetical protein AAGH78_18675, partial [Cyanobacteria bacterium P01_H01_bin.58]
PNVRLVGGTQSGMMTATADVNPRFNVLYPRLTMWFVALSLQALLFTHMVFLLRHGISLKGDGLEIWLLVATIIATGWVIAKVSFQRSPGWLKGIYIVNCLGAIPIGLTIGLMGLLMYATNTFGTFEAPSGTVITLKEHGGLLGCSVYPYVIQGIFEHRILQEDNYVFCFRPLESDSVEAVRWNPDETQLMLTVDQEDYIFELAPL